MKTLKVKDLVYSHANDKVGFIISIDNREDGIYYELQHPYEWDGNLSVKENDHNRLVEMSVAKADELFKIKINGN